jgi:hypothetical protein
MTSRIRGLALVACAFALTGCSDSPSEPEVEADPAVESLAATAHPAMPAGLHNVCLVEPDTLQFSETCPVVQWLGLTYWAYSHVDNRVSLTVVAYDSAGNVAGQWEKVGARYLWQITVDRAAATVTFHGQGDGVVTMSWDELRPT